MLKVFPAHRFLGAKRGLFDFLVGRIGGIAADIDRLQQKSISGTENAAYVIGAPYIFKDGNDGDLSGLPEFFHRFPVQFVHRQFSHKVSSSPVPARYVKTANVNRLTLPKRDAGQFSLHSRLTIDDSRSRLCTGWIKSHNIGRAFTCRGLFLPESL